MTIPITSRYLLFPVNTRAVRKTLIFSSGGREVYRLKIRLDNVSPDFTAPIDVSRFMGQTLTLSVSPEMEIRCTAADEAPLSDLYREPLRPQLHFTTKCGWNNDPNGLLFYGGVYHMFYQHNPAEPAWENMHWGHAVSRDLLHWREEKIALFPDERGAMYSGSAILDEENLLGKNENGRPAALLFYTTTAAFCQNLSYSTDGFRTIRHWDRNPVVPHIEGRNRDPKVVRCEELGCYVMALYLSGCTYALLTSDTLTEWRELQRIEMPEENECPDFFPLTASDGTRLWVLIGAHDRYLVGRIADGRFLPIQPIRSLHYGRTAYAGQTFSGLPDGRVVRIDWDRWNMTPQRFCGQMSIPTELSLLRSGDGYALAAAPIRELDSLLTSHTDAGPVSLEEGGILRFSLSDSAYRIRLAGTAAEGVMNLTVFGRDVAFDFAKNTIRVGQTEAPLRSAGTSWDATVIIDRCSIEIFADGGTVYLSALDADTVMDRNLLTLRIRTSVPCRLSCLTLDALRSVWTDD